MFSPSKGHFSNSLSFALGWLSSCVMVNSLETGDGWLAQNYSEDEEEEEEDFFFGI